MNGETRNCASVAVIGGGAAGMAAAISASKRGADVVLLEKNEKLGKKIYITGKGRCNVTNACDREELFENVVRNPKFLYSGFSAFGNVELMELLESSGCPLKTERGNRVFPASDRASDVTKALVRNLNRVSVRQNAEVSEFERRPGGGFRILIREQGRMAELAADRVVVATGGLSYPATGSTGDGFRFAKMFGHSVTDLRPALVGFQLVEEIGELAGLTLKNVRARVSLSDRKGPGPSEFGEMLFTHSGVSGPVILTLSSRINRENLRGASVVLDLKPALTQEELERRLVREFTENRNRQFKNILPALMPRSLIPVFLKKCGTDGEKEGNSVTQTERTKIADTLKNLSFPIRSLCGIESGIVTSGGVSVSELNPKTMESKLVPGLYFAGETLDTDALTGGFNLQIAFSTGWLAGTSAVGE